MIFLKQLYRKLVVRVASFQLVTAGCITAATGCLLVIYGGVYEARSQLGLLRHFGSDALDAYLRHVEAHRLPLAAFMVESVTGHCEAYGAFLRGAGLWSVFVVSPFVIMLGLIARSKAVTLAQRRA
jgi:hypothetical protein